MQNEVQTSTLQIQFGMDGLQKQMNVMAVSALAHAFEQLSGRKYVFSEYLNTKTLQEYLGCSEGYVRTLEQKGLPRLNIDGHKMYRRRQVDLFMDSYSV